MSHKSQSIKYSRTEAKRIYHQRQIINRLIKENQQLKEKINILTDKLEEVEGQYAFECGCNQDLVKYQNLIEHVKTLDAVMRITHILIIIYLIWFII